MIPEDTEIPHGTNIIILMAHRFLAILSRGKLNKYRGEKRDLTVYRLEIPDQVADFSFSFEDVHKLQLAAPPAPSSD